MRFVADSMLGKLARWLRVLGYDTCYQPYYGQGVIDQLVKQGRCLLSRHKDMADHYANTVLLHDNNVGEQIAELRQAMHLTPDQSTWFTRCLVCNALLEKPEETRARENVPEYIFYQNMAEIRFCPSCGRYYWPGSHRIRMLKQLQEWGFLKSQDLQD